MLLKGTPLDGPTVGGGFVTVRVREPTGSESTPAKMLVELVKFVGNDRPPSCTVAPVTNPEPVTFTNWGSPAKELVGVIEETIGAGFSTVNEAMFEIPADGDGFATVTPTVPAAPVRSDTKMEAVNCVELTNWVTRLTLFQKTVAPVAKLPPFTVSVNEPLPRTAVLGLREVRDGNGYSTRMGALFELPPPGGGVATVIGKLPTAVPLMADTGILAVRCELST